MSSEVIDEGIQLINRWVRATEALSYAKSQVNKAECNVANTRNALGKWLMPHDAKPGEKFAVWHLDSLIEVTVTDGDPELRIRSRGKSL